MKNRLIYTLILLAISVNIYPKTEEVEIDYRRSSIYSVLIGHTEQKFAEEIRRIFLQMPTPDKYNNHDLSIKALTYETSKYTSQKTTLGTSTTPKISASTSSEAENFLKQNQVASRLVAKWFNRNFVTGECDVELIKKRGVYNASEFDKEVASRSQRGIAILEDSGEELIGSTFVLMNDIIYVDKQEAAKAGGKALKILGALSAQLTGISVLSDVGNLAASITETLKGFKVKITTHLYQLEWNEEIANQFYTQWYTDCADIERAELFNMNRDKFKLKYIGTQDSDAKDVSVMGVNLDKPDAMVRKACQRALDENIANLQRNFEAFRVKVPLLTTEQLTADIGLKEGITPDSKFEVLEAKLDEDGKTHYNRIAIISPIKDKIWDNRYMATEEGATNSTLGKTIFRKVSGKTPYPGLLIREIR